MERPDLGRHVSDDIESEIVDSLLDTVSARFSLSTQYYGLKAKLMGVRKLKYHERNVAYGDVVKRYSFEKTVRLIERVLGNLDSEFLEILHEFLRSGQMISTPVRERPVAPSAPITSFHSRPLSSSIIPESCMMFSHSPMNSAME